MPELVELDLPLEKLLLDPNNYRFQDEPGYTAADPARFHEKTVQDRAYRRLRGEGLESLKGSILTNGFLPFERIVVRPTGSDDLHVVVEGNRRVAALRWIREDHEAGVNVPTGVVQTLDAVPTIAITDEADPAASLWLMGVRHVGGIRAWGGYQRAKLVTELRDGIGLDTAEIAARLGMSAWEVNRRYRAFKALQQMEGDERFGDRVEAEMYPLFHEAVAQPSVREWLGWDDSQGEFLNAEALEQFYELITPREQDDDRERPAKLPTREHVRDLRFVLPVAEAKRVLLDDARDFGEALGIAKADELSRSWATEVSAAISALNSVGALELGRLDEDGVHEIRRLRDLAQELLDTREKLKS
jgi:hypothetical protein